MARFEQRDLLGLWLLDLDDHVRSREHRRGIGRDPRAGIDIVLVLEIDTRAGAGLDQDVVSGGGQLGDRGRGKAHAIFVVLDLFGNSNSHRASPPNL